MFKKDKKSKEITEALSEENKEPRGNQDVDQDAVEAKLEKLVQIRERLNRFGFAKKIRQYIGEKTIKKIYMGLTIVLALVVIVIAVTYREKLTSFRPGCETYQVMGTIEIDYDKTAQMHLTDDDVVINDKNGSTESTGTPLIYPDSDKLTMMENMLWINPREGTEVSRVNTFTTIEESAGRVTYSRNKKMAQTAGGFLYDGRDRYVFLEAVDLTVGEDEIKLPPLSYIVVRRGDCIEYYNAGTGEDKSISLLGNVVTAKNKDYSLDATKGVIIIKNNEYLLYEDVASVDPMKMK